MDALSEALKAVHVTGAVFFNAECSAPWGFAVPSMQRVAHVLAPGAERVVNFHLVTEGRASVRFENAAAAELVAGDVMILPHGDAHVVSNGRPATVIDSAAALGRNLNGELATMQFGSGGEATRFVCGFLGCERHADRLFLAGLPQFIRINIRGDAAGNWLEASIRHLVSEAGSGRPGREVLLSRMADALFVEVLRRYMEALPPEQIGWLAAARDPVVGAVLVQLHRRPERRWTVDELAAEVGHSRSVVADRFSRFLGEPPLTYLARWRLQLAARLLRATRRSVLQIAGDVGYENEAAFNRAFKREFGLPPAQYRRRSLAADRRPG